MSYGLSVGPRQQDGLDHNKRDVGEGGKKDGGGAGKGSKGCEVLLIRQIPHG